MVMFLKEIAKNITIPLCLRHDVEKEVKTVLRKYIDSETILYDIGCGQKPLESFLKNKVAKHIGIDLKDGFYKNDKVDIVGSAYDVPLPDNSAHIVLSNQVLEHLENPWDALKESNRLLKQKGLIILTFPFLYPVHAAPHDFGRYTNFQVTKKLNENNFDVLEHKEIGGVFYCIGNFLAMHMDLANRGLLKKLKITSILMWICRTFFSILHITEGLLMKIFKTPHIRSKWVMNYVVVAQKRQC